MKNIALAAMACLAISSCNLQKESLNTPKPFPDFSTEAHRGGRGLMPENSIIAMKHAIDLGVTTLEMDAQITKDHQVVLAHDHYINRLFSLDPNGNEIPEQEAKSHVIYEMNYDQVEAYDIGLKTNEGFPQQKNVPAHIPLLNELIDSVQHHLKVTQKKQVFYNIETKSSAKGDGIFHPGPEEFVDLLMDVIEKKAITPWVIIQSFDVRTLQVLKQKYPHVRTSYLVSKGSLADNLEILGFIPDIYSPVHKLVDQSLVKACHDQGIKILPWTPNTIEDINALKALGVDGIITDYPNLF